MSEHCKSCGRELDTDDPDSLDCGGDCLGCISEIESHAPPDFDAIVLAGHAGHDHEITITLTQYGHGAPLDKTDGPIPRSVEARITEGLPESWKIENRGSRLEVHPSGHFAGSFDQLDIDAVLGLLRILGYKVDDRTS